MNHNVIYLLSLVSLAIVISCSQKKPGQNENVVKLTEMQKKVNSYAVVRLTTDTSQLTTNEKKMILVLYDAMKLMDDIYWEQTFGDKNELFGSIKDPDIRKFAEINYGPWDRLDDNAPFVPGFNTKPAGANFYPADITREEFDALKDPAKNSLYTVIRRNMDKQLEVVWYKDAYKEKVEKAASLLKQAAELADDTGLKKYLNLRAEALLTDNYQPSDMAWLDMKTNKIDVVIGPIENYEDAFMGIKAAHEGFILVKDMEWSKKLSIYAKFLPELQKQLPVDDKYKKEAPGSDSELNAYDVVCYAGDCNAGSKTIAINLPNDEEVQLKKGTRKLQLKNSMKAKFDHIMMPITNMLIDKDQRQHVTFDAFFANVMFHEVAHGLGIKNTINGKGTVREALKEQYSAIEEGKADILGLFLITKLHEKGQFTDKELMDNYITFMAGIFRSVRFGAASAHGKANMIRFNFFNERGAFVRNGDGTYKVNFEKMKVASVELTSLILKMQGDGDYELAKKTVEENGVIKDQLKADLAKLGESGIPVDVVFEQGPEILGLK